MIEPVLIPILGVMIPIVVVPASLTFKYFKLKRECEHAERMRHWKWAEHSRATNRGGPLRRPSWRSVPAYLSARSGSPGSR